MLKRLRKKRNLLVNLLLILIISGCGLKGPLYQSSSAQQEQASKSQQKPATKPITTTQVKK
jgi:predicted small lipoprotein YifL